MGATRHLPLHSRSRRRKMHRAAKAKCMKMSQWKVVTRKGRERRKRGEENERSGEERRKIKKSGRRRRRKGEEKKKKLEKRPAKRSCLLQMPCPPHGLPQACRQEGLQAFHRALRSQASHRVLLRLSRQSQLPVLQQTSLR